MTMVAQMKQPSSHRFSLHLKIIYFLVALQFILFCSCLLFLHYSRCFDYCFYGNNRQIISDKREKDGDRMKREKENLGSFGIETMSELKVLKEKLEKQLDLLEHKLRKRDINSGIGDNCEILKYERYKPDPITGTYERTSGTCVEETFLQKYVQRAINFTIKTNPELKGEKGQPGESRQTGYSVRKVVIGQKSEPGEKGDAGQKGDLGENEQNGEDGVKDDSEDKEASGRKGKKRELGDSGISGEKGKRRSKGYRGFEGVMGKKGKKGEKRNRGEIGSLRRNEISGEKGEKGATGEKGNTGSQNERREKGNTGEEAEMMSDEASINDNSDVLGGCVLDRIGEPELLNIQPIPEKDDRLLMVDPLRNESDKEFSIWFYEDSMRGPISVIYNLKEYRFKTSNQSEVVNRPIAPKNLQRHQFFVGVMYNGSFYSVKENELTITKYNMATNKTIEREIDSPPKKANLYAVYEAIWVLYEKDEHHYTFLKLNPENLHGSDTQIPIYCNLYRLFFAHGRMYCLDGFNEKIDFVLDVFDRPTDSISLNYTKVVDIRSTFLPRDSIDLPRVCYNYKTQYLYVYDKYNVVRYKLYFKDASDEYISDCTLR